MPKNDIGGFFVSLGMNIDKNSFDTGNKLVDSVANSFNKLIGSARNAAVVLAGTAVATGTIESQAGKLAEEIGISTEALDLWKATAKIAGADANGLVTAMAGIANVLQRMDIDGAGLEELTKHLGELGIVSNEKIDIEKLLNLSPEELVQEVLEISHRALANGANKQDVQQIVKDIIGKEGEKLFIDLERRGMTITKALNEAQKTVFTTVEDNQKGQGFITEVNTFKTEMESLGKLIGDNVGGELTPFLKDINEWIQDNGKAIKDAVENIAGLVGKISASNVSQDMGKLLSATIKIIGGDKKGALEDLGSTNVITGAKKWTDVREDIEKWKKQNPDAKKDWKRRYLLSEMPLELQEAILANSSKYWKRFDNVSYDIDTPGDKPKNKVKDGIIRPDGNVTQVAPDDWVFAARNIGDMARAFIPQNHTSMSAGEYIINQTINIGGGNDMPQVLRQEAYRGTQEGLLQLMEESSRRLQLMSGTR